MEVYASDDPTADVIIHSAEDGCACEDPGVPAFLAEAARQHGDLVLGMKALSGLVPDQVDEPTAKRPRRGSPRRRGKGTR